MTTPICLVCNISCQCILIVCVFCLFSITIFLSFLQTWLPLRTTWPWYYLGSPRLITATPVNIAAPFVLFFYENNSLLQSIISLKTCVFVSCVCVYTCVWVCAIHEPSRDLNFCGIILQSVYKITAPERKSSAENLCACVTHTKDAAPASEVRRRSLNMWIMRDFFFFFRAFLSLFCVIKYEHRS